VALAVALAAATLATASAAPASAAQYWVVAHADGPRALRPEILTRVIPPLPPGAHLEGQVRCNRVYVPGTADQTQLAQGGIAAGVYQFVTSSCTSDPGDPVRLVGTSGDLRILGGQWAANPDPTVTETAAVVNSDPDEPSVAFTAHVINVVGDGVHLRGVNIRFSFETSNGLYEGACVTPTAETFEAVAECLITGDKARAFLAGTGTWWAEFDGTTNSKGSAGSGRAPGGATDPATAAARRQQFFSDPVTIIKNEMPPGCYRDRDETSVSIIGVSLGVLDCSQVQVLQTVTHVFLGITAVGSGGGALVAKAAEKIAFAAVKASIKEAAKAAAKRAVAGFAVIG
jgi:hypothetical protein